MNIADSSIAGWNYGRAEPGYSDGYNFTIPVGRYAPQRLGPVPTCTATRPSGA